MHRNLASQVRPSCSSSSIDIGICFARCRQRIRTVLNTLKCWHPAPRVERILEGDSKSYCSDVVPRLGRSIRRAGGGEWTLECQPPQPRPRSAVLHFIETYLMSIYILLQMSSCTRADLIVVVVAILTCENVLALSRRLIRRNSCC